MIGILLGNLDGIILGLDVGTDLVSLDGFFEVSNDRNLRYYCLEIHWNLLIVKLLALMKASNLDLLVLTFFGTILGNVDEIILGLDVGT